MYRTHIGLTSVTYYPFHTQIDPNKLGIATERSLLTRAALFGASLLRDTVFFKIWVYIVLALVTLYFLTKEPSPFRQWIVGLLSVGFINGTTNFFIIPAADWRYSLTFVTACLLAGLVFWITRKKYV